MLPTPPTLPAPSGASITTSAYLNVSGATLYYEIYGDGPTKMLFIPGGNGHLDVWRPVAKILAQQYDYHVAIYDRRGFSRSYLSSTMLQDYSKRLETDATDAKLLLEALATTGARAGKIAVLGTSSGAIIALKLLEMFPEAADKVLVNEPPLLSILPDKEELVKKQREVYEIYRAFGIPPAMQAFAQLASPGSSSIHPSSNFLGTATVSLAGPDARENPYLPNNMQYWFEREMLQYTLAELDLEAIGKGKHRLMLVNGEETDPSAPMFRPALVMGERFGVQVQRLPGDHMGYQKRSGEWAAGLADIMRHCE